MDVNWLEEPGGLPSPWGAFLRSEAVADYAAGAVFLLRPCFSSTGPSQGQIQASWLGRLNWQEHRVIDRAGEMEGGPLPLELQNGFLLPWGLRWAPRE